MEYWVETIGGISHAVIEIESGERRNFPSQIIGMVLIDDLVFNGLITEAEADEVWDWIYFVSELPLGQDGCLLDVDLLPDFQDDLVLETDVLDFN